MVLNNESNLTVLNCLNGDDDGTKSLRIFRLDNAMVYITTTKELPIFIRAANQIVKNPTK